MLNEPPVEATLLNVANRYSQGISSIAGLRQLSESELDSHHLLNLLFIALSIAGYLLLYPGWRVIIDRQPLVGSCQDSNGLCSANSEC